MALLSRNICKHVSKKGQLGCDHPEANDNGYCRCITRIPDDHCGEKEMFNFDRCDEFGRVMEHPFLDLTTEELDRMLGIVKRLMDKHCHRCKERAENIECDTLCPCRCHRWPFKMGDWAWRVEDDIVMVHEVDSPELGDGHVKLLYPDGAEVWAHVSELIPMPLSHQWQSLMLSRLKHLTISPPIPDVTIEWNAEYEIDVDTWVDEDDNYHDHSKTATTEHMNPHFAAALAYADLMEREKVAPKGNLRTTTDGAVTYTWDKELEFMEIARTIITVTM